MARIDFTEILDVTAEGDRIMIRAAAGNHAFDFSISASVVGVLFPLLQQAARHLPDTPRVERFDLGFQPIVDQATGLEGIRVRLAQGVEIPLLLGQSGLEALQACIDQMRPREQPAPSGGTVQH